MEKDICLFICRICGIEDLAQPWGEDGKTPSFRICMNCNVEYGFEDDQLSSLQRYRNIWLQAGNTITAEGMENLKACGWVKDN